MSKSIQLKPGEKFGCLTVVKPCGVAPRNQWWFLCDCGMGVLLKANKVKSGNNWHCSRFCITKHKYRTEKRLTDLPEYRAWRAIRGRCNSPSYTFYEYYGGRGIRVCERWSNFADFLADIGPRPSSKHSIDRIDNNGDYEPGNCRWATRIEQARNTRHSNRITFEGVTRSRPEWAERTGLTIECIRGRQRRGWSVHLLFSAA